MRPSSDGAKDAGWTLKSSEKLNGINPFRAFKTAVVKKASVGSNSDLKELESALTDAPATHLSASAGAPWKFCAYVALDGAATDWQDFTRNDRGETGTTDARVQIDLGGFPHSAT